VRHLTHEEESRAFVRQKAPCRHGAVEPKRRPDNLKTVREQNGPGYNSKSIRNPVVTELKAGDVMVVPAGTGHWFTKSEEQSLNYLKSESRPDGKQ
jgi:hypothetical protein